MTDVPVAIQVNCRQCAAPLTVEQGQPFVVCRFCGATNYVDKSRAVFHYQVRSTVDEKDARAELNRWMAGNATVKDLDRKAKVDSVSFQYFPLWLVRAEQAGLEHVVLKPAAALSISELAKIDIPAADLVPFAVSDAGSVIPPTVPYEMMQQWLLDDQNLQPEMIREVALVHVPIYVAKYTFGGKSYTALVDAATSKVFANIYPAKWEVPYLGLGCAAFIAFLVLSVLALATSLGFYLVGTLILAMVFFVLAAAVTARV